MRNSGSTRLFTWLATRTMGCPSGNRPAPTTSTRRKKIRRIRRTTRTKRSGDDLIQVLPDPLVPGPRRRQAAPFVDEAHPDQAEDEEAGGRQDADPLRAGGRGEQAEAQRADHVGSLARQSPEAEELRGLLRRCE